MFGNSSDYYFDVETTSEGSNAKDAAVNPETAKIVTVQYQKLDARGRPIGELKILKEWELGEKGIVETVKPLLEDEWGFIPVGYRLFFDYMLINAKLEKYFGKQLPCEFWMNRPAKDLKVVGVLLNNGRFRGSSLDEISKMLNLTHKKQQNGSQVPVWYQEKKYEKIEQYIREEASAFEELYQKVLTALRNLGNAATLDIDADDDA